jgi:phosphomannomutase
MTRTLAELRTAARAWISGDPDPATRAELQTVLDACDVAELDSRLAPLAFGTAGLRGAVGAGPGRMNVAVVIRTACGIARYLAERPELAGRPIVIGFDARPTSRAFARASAAVLVAAGHRVLAFPEPRPTPLAAFFGRELSAAITIVVTASHNPRPDNGYKVYGPSAVQIVSPVDADMARHIASAPAARDVPLAEEGWETFAPDLEEPYFDAVSAAFPASTLARGLAIVHSALHGVGSASMQRTLADAGFHDVHVVPEQAEPDGAFPTTPFPNPEEPGTLDLALAEAERRSADLLLVSDPDADRLAAAARLDHSLTVLDGNQVGALLADYLLTKCEAPSSALVLTSVVSSPLVAAMCAAYGAQYERTHTGFKWLWSAALALESEGRGRFCFAYEEALGYSVFPAVRDKDGIAAGRALAEHAAQLAARGRTLFDRLYELYSRYGLWTSSALNLSLTGADAQARLGRALDALVSEPDLDLAGDALIRVIDYREGASERAPWLGAAALVELELASGARLFVRPSGTEPKLKLYGHVRREVTLRSDFRSALPQAREDAEALLRALAKRLRL